MQKEIAKLAFDLCNISSITGDELNAQEYLEKFLQAQGFLTQRIYVDKKRFNIFAYLNKKAEYLAMLCTHIDTVAPFIPPKIENHILYGRGSCDAKGIAAAMVYAALEQKKIGHEDVCLLFTVGEEISSDGAKVANDELKNKAKYIIIGEPTELKFASSQKGALVFDLVARGKEAHSAMPELGSSAIHKLVLQMSKLLEVKWPNTNEFGETLLNFGQMEGGQARNMLANFAKAEGVMRLSAPVKEIEEILEKNMMPDIELKIISKTDPFCYFVPKNKPSFIAGFSSDAPYLTKVGQAMLMGPGSLNYAHKENEQIGLDEIHQGYLEYINLINILREK